MSKKKNNKKDNVLIQTVKMQGEQAMHLVKQAKFNQNLLDEVIGLKDEMDRNVKNEKTLEELQPTVEALATNLDQILGEVVTRFEFDKLKKEIEELKGKQDHE